MANKPTRTTAFYKGSSGRAKAEEELAKQKARAEARKEQSNMPFRFRVDVGGTSQFVVIDDTPDFYRFEHNLKNPQTGYWNIFTGCTKEWDNCPACEAAGRDSYYAMYLTVLDFTPFETRDGVKHDFSRKLLVVKPAQQKKFHRAASKAEKEGRSLRGAIFEVTRDGDKDSSIGNDIELIDWMEEDELETYVRSWKDKEGKKHTEKCFEVYDYEELFGEPDSEQLRALLGAAPAPGSRAHEDRELGRRPRARSNEDSDGDGNWEKAERKDRMPAGRRSRPVDDGEAEEDAPPARGRRPAARDEEPAERPRRGRAAAEEPEEEEPRPARRGAAAPARGRGRTEEPPFDADEDDKPTPGAGRRVAMRGKR